jgi:hypothetical protein
LAIVYLLLFAADVAAAIRQRIPLVAAISAVMVLSLALLGLWWISWPV